MLPRGARLCKERDHELVRRAGRRSSDQFLTVKMLNSSNKYARIAVVVSKRVDKRATARNRIKRQIRAIIEEIYNKLRFGVDMVVIVNPAARSLTRKDLENKLLNLLNRLSLIT